MGVGVIGPSGPSGSSILGAGDEVLAGKFGVFGKYSQTLQAGEYVASATTGSAGGTEVAALLGTTGTSVNVKSSAVSVISVPENQDYIIFSALPSTLSVTEDPYTLNAIDSSAETTTWNSTPTKEIFLASDNNGKVVSAINMEGYSTSGNYYYYSALESCNPGLPFTRGYSVNLSGNSGGPKWTYLSYSQDEFLAIRRASSSSHIGNYPNVIYRSTDGENWTSTQPIEPFGSSSNDNYRPQFITKHNNTFYMRSTNTGNNFQSSILYKTTDLTDANSYSDAETGVFNYLNKILSGSPDSIATDGAGTWVATDRTSLTTSSSVKSLMYSLDDGATWELANGVPTGLSHFTNAVYDPALSLWFVAYWNGSQSDIMYASSPDGAWSTYSLANAATGSAPYSLYKLGNNGWQIVGTDARYNAWTSSTDPRTTSWSSSSSGSAYAYPHKLKNTNFWFAMDGSYLAYSTNTNPNGNSYSTTQWSNMAGQSYSSGLAPDYNVSYRPTGTTFLTAYRAYDGSQYQNYYARSTNGSSWTRYLAPIGSNSSSVPVARYAPNIDKFIITNSSTDEYATSTDGLTWTVSANPFTISFNYPWAGYDGELPTNAAGDKSYNYSTFNGIAAFAIDNSENITNLSAGTILYSKPSVQNGITWSDGTNNYITLATSIGHLMTSSDGTNWSEQKLGDTTVYRMVTFDNQLFVNMRDPQDSVYKWYKTSDGITYTLIDQLDGQNVKDIVKVETGKYVGIETSTLQSFWASTDLVNWDRVTRGISLADYDVLASSTNVMAASDGQRAIISLRDYSLGEYGPAVYGSLDSKDVYGVTLFNSTFEAI